MARHNEKWLVIDDIVTHLSYLSFPEGKPQATFVKRVEEAQRELNYETFDVLSLDFNLDWIGAGTTQPLVDWLIEPEQTARFVESLMINVHSMDNTNAQRIANQLIDAGYTVDTYGI